MLWKARGISVGVLLPVAALLPAVSVLSATTAVARDLTHSDVASVPIRESDCARGTGWNLFSASSFLAEEHGRIGSRFLTQPPVVSRISWGCPDGTNSPAWLPEYTAVTNLVVHHSAGENTSPDWAAVVLSIWYYHTLTRGWGDIGYNYLIDPRGVIYEGRAGGDNVKGAHFACQNSGTMGVCLLGNYSTASPTAAALASLHELLAWKADQRGIDPFGNSYHSGTQRILPNICGHRDANPAYPEHACSTTTCPGDVLYGLLPGIRASVEGVINGAPAQLSGMTMSNGAFEFLLNGPVGSSYVVQCSSNLVDWLPVTTNTIPGSGSVLITDANASNLPKRFFRAVTSAPP